MNRAGPESVTVSLYCPCMLAGTLWSDDADGNPTQCYSRTWLKGEYTWIESQDVLNLLKSEHENCEGGICELTGLRYFKKGSGV